MKFVFLIFTALQSLCSFAVAEEKFFPELYAFFNGTPKASFEKEAEFFKQTGYAGISQVYENGTGKKLEERVAAYEKSGIRVLSVYLSATKDPIKEEAVKGLAHRGGIIELTVKTITPEVVDSIRRTAIMAEILKIKVAEDTLLQLAQDHVKQERYAEATDMICGFKLKGKFDI